VQGLRRFTSKVHTRAFILLFILTHLISFRLLRSPTAFATATDFMAQKSAFEETVEAESYTFGSFFPGSSIVNSTISNISAFQMICSGKLQLQNWGPTKSRSCFLGTHRDIGVANSTILGCYNSCLKKMRLYPGVMYGSGEWRELTSHQKQATGDDC
jgi:hypothetical protein